MSTTLPAGAADDGDAPAPAAPVPPATTAADKSPTTELSTVHVEGELLKSALAPVDGYVAERNRSATKTDTPLLKTPQSVTQITADQIKAQNANDVRAALRYVGGVVPELRGTSGSRYDQFNLRGFTPEQYLDGLRLGTYYYTQPKTDPYLLERVEVLKGPASVLYGQTPPGGIVNYVSKRPSAAAQNEFFVQGGNDARFRSGFDVGGKLDDDGKVRYRLVGVGQRRDGPQHGVESANFSVAPAFSFDLGDATRLTVMAKYRHDPAAGSYGSLPYEGSVAPLPDGDRIKRSFYDGDKGYNHFDRTARRLGIEFSHAFNEHVSFRQHLRYGLDEVDYHSVYGWGWAAGSHKQLLNRDLTNASESRNTLSIDNQLLFKFDTGALHHKVLAGVDYQNLGAHLGNSPYGESDVPPLNIDHPDHHQTITAAPRDHTDFTQNQLGYYLQDQISLGNLVLIGGGRYDHIHTAQTNRTEYAHETRSDHAATVRAGALYAFDFGLSPYVSYSESFQPPSTSSVDSDVLEPTRGNQYEIGVKYQPDAHVMLTASGFRIRQKNVNGPRLPNGYVAQTGEVELWGGELEAKASLAAGLDLTAAGTYLDSEIIRSDQGNHGNALEQTPKYSASLWMDYTQPGGRWKGLGGGGGVRYLGSQQVDNANTAKVPDATLFDATAHYKLGGLSNRLKGWKVAVNVDNLFNKKYVASCASTTTCYYGYGRQATATLRYQWD